jgi:YHS domain-containing protein
VTGLILRIILVLIVLRLIWKFIRGVLEGAGFIQRPAHPSVGLVRDPVCGVFVVPTNALTAGSGLDTRYFCSEKCRAEWRRSKAS